MRAVAAAFFLLVAAAQAAEPEPRPRIGLVLGGGGARGAAHIGVLEVLEENRVPIDCIAGTSMGAVIGGAYAAGVSPGEMKDSIRKTDWASIFDDTAGRDLVNLRRKQLDDRFNSGLEFGVGGGGLKYRSGAIAGEKLKLLFNELVREDLGERTIEDLPLPLAILATDIGTGERIAIRKGGLTSAMRSSMSVPGVLAPTIRDGRKLVDGGLVDNVPISEVLDLCKPDIVIAVNVGSPLYTPEEVTGLITVVGQMVNLLAEQNVARSLTLLRKQDLYLRPELGDITSASFDRQIEAAERGRKSALEVAPVIQTLSVSREQYHLWRSRVREMFHPKPPVIDEVRIAETRYVSPEHIREGLRVKEGEPLDSKKLTSDLVWVFSQGDLQSLDYSVQREEDKTILRITPIEKAWGPNYLRFGLNLASDFRSQADYNVRALYRRTWMNRYGGEWLLGGQIGSEQFIATEFYQPLDYGGRFFVRPYGGVSSRVIGLYDDGDRIAEYSVRDSRGGVEAGMNLGIYGQARVGWRARHTRSERDTGSTILPDVTEGTTGFTATLALDNQDQAFFPTKGIRGNVEYFDAYRVKGDLGKYGRLVGNIEGAYSFRDFTVIGEVEGGKTMRGSLPLSDLFALGGPRHLSAFANDQLLGEEFAYGRIEAQWRLTKPIPLLGLNLIAGVLAETGRMKRPVTEPNLTGWQNSFGAYIAANTFFGPVYFGYSDGKNGSGRFYLFVGTP
jgi:NTE family protein